MVSKAVSNADQWSTSATSGTQALADEPFEMPFAPGQILANKYEILQLLGVGGVGFVVAANHIELAEKVALKFLKPDMLANPQVIGRFAQEALAAVRIKSEHVARVFDVGSLEDGTPFIVMEFLEGRDLYDVITQDGPQPIRRAIDYALQACEALAAAHACGVVHRDIKPENLFLLRRAEGLELIKVLDFGISKVALTGSVSTSKVPMFKTMLPVGSPVYMSPEQIRSPNDIDCRTDIWSMGCVLYELLTGSAPFDAPSLTQLTAAILEISPQPASAGRTEIPADLDTVVARCLEKKPTDRYQNVAELALALYPFASRRSRIYAENCCRLSKVPGTTNAEFELPSICPPAGESSTSGSFPTSRQSNATANIPMPPTDIRDTPPSPHRSRRMWLISIGAIAALVAAFATLRNRPARSDLATGAALNSRHQVAPIPLLPINSSPAPSTPNAPHAEVTAAATSPSPNVAQASKSATPTLSPSTKSAWSPRRVQRTPTRGKMPGSGEVRPATNADPDPGF